MQDLIVVFAAKGRTPAQHDEHHNSHRPVVTLGRVASLQNLGRDVVRGAVRGGHEFVLGDFLRQAEVYQFNMRIVIFLIEQKVLWLDVPIRYR